MQSLFSIWGIGTANISYGDDIGVYEEAVVHPLEDARTVADVRNARLKYTDASARVTE